MKRLTLLMTTLALVTCSKHYLSQGALARGFDTKRTYRVAIMPFAITGAETQVEPMVREAALTQLSTILTGTGRFLVIDRAKVEQAIRVNEFGTTRKVDALLARKIGKECGADLVCLSELELTETKGLRILAKLRILDVNQDYDVYIGQGRADNPVAPEAGAETAVQFATQVLVDALK